MVYVEITINTTSLLNHRSLMVNIIFRHSLIKTEVLATPMVDHLEAHHIEHFLIFAALLSVKSLNMLVL